jgi:hypothetical protein
MNIDLKYLLILIHIAYDFFLVKDNPSCHAIIVNIIRFIRDVAAPPGNYETKLYFLFEDAGCPWFFGLS